MNAFLTMVIFGWPAMLAVLLVAGIGLVWKRWPFWFFSNNEALCHLLQHSPKP